MTAQTLLRPLNARHAGALLTLVATLTVSSALSLGLSRPVSLAEKRTAACTGPEYRQFDFWLGDWDVWDRNATGSPKARAHINAILDGCAIHETYEAVAGLVGQSFSSYYAPTRRWHQSWVTNRGELLLLDGAMHADSMILEGTMRDSAGRPALLRGIWTAHAGAVLERAESSVDSGKSWKPVFDIVFRRHP
jgi:hypothetical protein